jgi:hypothetical protein
VEKNKKILTRGRGGKRINILFFKTKDLAASLLEVFCFSPAEFHILRWGYPTNYYNKHFILLFSMRKEICCIILRSIMLTEPSIKGRVPAQMKC